MLEKLLNGTKTLEKTLDAAWLRNEAISQNIANVDTPGYKRKTVSFEEHLKNAMDGGGIEGTRTDKRHIPINPSDAGDAEIEVSEDNSSLSMRLDGNNVDVDNEMSLMAQNTIKYNVLIQRINGSFRKLKSVISEGRK